MPKKRIVFVHGMFMTGPSWSDWKAYFEARGYECLAPSWPGREGDPASLREAPDPALSQLRLGDVVSRMRAVIDALPEPPILIGHSMGGLVVQLLMQERKGERAVMIAPAPPNGVRSFALSHLRANAALLAPTSKPIVPSFSWFRSSFAHLLPEAEASAIYSRWAVPESRLVGRGPLGAESKVDFARPDRPMLFLAGGADRIIPASLVEKVAARYRAAGAAVTAETLPERTHSLYRDSGWTDVAARVERWLET